MLLQRASPCTSQVSRSRAPHGRLSTAAARTTYSAAPPQQSSDVVAGLMRAAMELSLKRRLQGYESVNCNVAVDVATLLDGRFAALQIDGLGWTTPLGMTARRLKVDIDEVAIDYSTLLLERRVSLRNVPLGRVAITLTPRDLGNFMSHPLFVAAAASAVQGVAFSFDPDSVTITPGVSSSGSSGGGGGGRVCFTGTWAADGRRYRVVMLPGVPSVPGQRPPPLRVGAQALLSDSVAPVVDAGAQAVAAGIASFFSSLSLDLQGIDVHSPLLSLHSDDRKGQAPEDLLLQIVMRVRLRGFPPLDMQF